MCTTECWCLFPLSEEEDECARHVAVRYQIFKSLGRGDGKSLDGRVMHMMTN